MRLLTKALTSAVFIALSIQCIHAQGAVPPPGGAVPPPGGAVPPPGGQGNQGIGNNTKNGGVQSGNVGGQNQPGRTNNANQSTFGRVNQNAWFMDKNIQSQLKVNAEQAKLLNKQYADHYGNYNKGQTQFNGSTILTDEQRAAQLQSTNRFYDDFGRSTNDIFDANQRTRFNQLSLQYRGYQAFNDPTITERLRLSNDQLAKIRTYEQTYDQQLANVYKFRSTDPNAFPTRFGELRKDMYGRINTVLTPEQLQVWKELVGDPYDFRVE